MINTMIEFKNIEYFKVFILNLSTILYRKNFNSFSKKIKLTQKTKDIYIKILPENIINAASIT